MAGHSDKLQQLILESIGEAVFTVDDEWRITFFNRAAETMTGIAREEAMGMKCHDVFKADICQGRCALRRTLDTGEALADVRVTILNRSMDEVPVRISTELLRDAQGTVLGGVEIMRDMSDLERLRKSLVKPRVFHDIVGDSPAMRQLFRLLPDVARSDVPVLVDGPSGTGKELVARAIHLLSDRSTKPFLQVNCGALPDTLLESELFGHRRGSFTGAHRDHPGRFEVADGGTIFLDEIGDTSPAFQVKLLRALQEGQIHPLGATAPIAVDVRVISATNRDLEDMVRKGQFREDLFYRLRVMPLHLPALRERREDILMLAEHLLQRVALKRGRIMAGFSEAATRVLADYDFPGNVRELENIIERALVLCHGDTIELHHLPDEVARPPAGDPQREGGAPEKVELLRALSAHKWNRQATADALGISRTTLWRHMKRHGLLG